MGRGPISPLTDSFEQLDAFYEILLKKSKLGIDDLRSQTLPQLRQSLESINMILMNPQQFATFKVTPEINNVSLGGMMKGEIQVGPLPILLARKKLILDGIVNLEAEELEKMADRHNDDLADHMTKAAHDEFSNEDLGEKIIELKQKNINTQKEAKETAIALKVANEENIEKIDWLTRQREMRENMKAKWAILQTFLEKESVSTIVGGMLLIIITITQVIAIFTHITSSDILNNSFLVILGYFFGQTVGRASAVQQKT